MANYSAWKIDRLAGVATWGAYRIKWFRRSVGAHYWAYGPGGQFLGTGWGADASSFIELCERHAAAVK